MNALLILGLVIWYLIGVACTVKIAIIGDGHLTLGCLILALTIGGLNGLLALIGLGIVMAPEEGIIIWKGNKRLGGKG